MNTRRIAVLASTVATSVTIALAIGVPTATASPAGVSSGSPVAQAGLPMMRPGIDSNDVRDIKLYTKWILQDIKALDERLGDGIGMASRLSMLADNYTRLLGATVPPKAKPAGYKARVATLASFASQASDEYLNDDEMAGAARYTVIRKETGKLLTMINKGLGTKFRLPAVAATSTTGSTPTATTPVGLSPSDITAIKTYADRVIRDITELDIRVQDGIGMPGRLTLLAGDYTNLLNAAVPTGADPADYKARCQTLANFANLAASEYSSGNSLAGSARYAVIRKETAPLLDAINKGLGTTYALP